MTRRDAVSRMGKAAYIAPAVTVLGLGSIRQVAASSHEPPPDPGTNSLIELEHRLLLEERIPAGPDPLNKFGGDSDNGG